jgi:serine/threonine-protein kinase
LEQVSIASFTGFEGALLSIGLITLLSMPGLVVACMAMGGVFFCQWQRIIEGKDFPILAGLSLALMSIPALRGNLSFPVVMAIALVAGAALVAALLLFTLIYHIVTRLMSR